MKNLWSRLIAGSTLLFFCALQSFTLFAQPSYDNYALVWSDEFNGSGLPDPDNWWYEQGYVRNDELQYYTAERLENVRQEDGRLVIEARRDNWDGHEYTSASLYSRGRREFQYGIFEMRAKIDVRQGSWPAFWTLGVSGEWPSNGEVDIMEYYAGSLHANVAWGTATRWQAHWDSQLRAVGSSFAEDYHVWRMLWTEDVIELYVDDYRQNTTDLNNTFNDSDGRNPFRQRAYIMLNQAIGSNGGDPSGTEFPVRYEIDYVRVYQEYPDTAAPRVIEMVASQDGTASILFSEGLDAASARDLRNYAVDDDLTLVSADLQSDMKTIVLSVDGLIPNNTFSVNLRGITDDADPANELPASRVEAVVGPSSERLSATVMGAGEPWNNTPGAEYGSAVDGDVATFSDCVADTVWVGYDFGEDNDMIVTGARYYPRDEYADRMRGRTIEVSSDKESWETVYTIPQAPPQGRFTSVAIVYSQPIRYIRYNGTGGYLNVSEIEFFGYPSSPSVQAEWEKKPTPARFSASVHQSQLRFSLYTLSGRVIESRVISSQGEMERLLGRLKFADLSKSPYAQGVYLAVIHDVNNTVFYKRMLSR